MTSLEWFNVVASVASILGFFVSIGALFFAKSAASRAREARDAVQHVYIVEQSVHQGKFQKKATLLNSLSKL